MGSFTIDASRRTLETGEQAIVVTAADEVVHCSPELLEAWRTGLEHDPTAGRPTLSRDDELREILTVGTPGHGLGVVRYLVDTPDKIDVTAFGEPRGSRFVDGHIPLRRIHDDT